MSTFRGQEKLQNTRQLHTRARSLPDPAKPIARDMPQLDFHATSMSTFIDQLLHWQLAILTISSRNQCLIRLLDASYYRYMATPHRETRHSSLRPAQMALLNNEIEC